MNKISYRRHRFPAEIIQRAVWLCFRFPLSYRDVEDLLAERGVDVSYETIRRGVVTLTAIWPACGRRRRRLCNGRHLPPLSHRVAAELAECSAGDQMALDVEEVVDGRMDGEEPLRGRGRFEPLHLSLSSSHRLM